MTGENDTFQHKSLYVTARYSKLEFFFLKIFVTYMTINIFRKRMEKKQAKQLILVKVPCCQWWCRWLRKPHLCLRERPACSFQLNLSRITETSLHTQHNTLKSLCSPQNRLLWNVNWTDFSRYLFVISAKNMNERAWQTCIPLWRNYGSHREAAAACGLQHLITSSTVIAADNFSLLGLEHNSNTCRLSGLFRGHGGRVFTVFSAMWGVMILQF